MQNVPFVVRKLREAECSVTFERDGLAIPFELGRDGTLSAAVEPADTLDAEMVFVGYGLDVPEAGYSDLKGVDLRGKIAVVLINDADFEIGAGDFVFHRLRPGNVAGDY